MTEDLTLALAAGVLAAVNPCGFALLPAYLSLLVLDASDPSRARAVGRALASTAALTIGFVAVFAVFGVVISPIAAGIQRYLPAVTVLIGVSVLLVGGWLLSGRSLPVIGWSPQGRRPTRRFAAMIGFGATYAIASLTCTIAPFLAIVVASLRSGSVAEGALLFVAYGIGMGLLVGSVALAIALARSSLVHRLRRMGAAVPRLAGLLLVVVGGYVAYYGWWELRVLSGAGAADDPVISLAAQIQGWLAAYVRSLDIGWLVAVVVGLSAVGLLAGRVRASRRRSSAADETDSDRVARPDRR